MKLKNKKGLTIVETIVAIAIFTIGIEGFTLLFAKSWRANSYIFEMGQSAFAVSQGVNKIASYIRKTRQADDGAYPKTYPVGDQQTQTIAENIVNGASTPVFYYYNKDYPGDQANNPVSTPADVSVIRLVKILLEINIDINHSPDNIHQQTFVELRNLNDYDRVQ